MIGTIESHDKYSIMKIREIIQEIDYTPGAKPIRVSDGDLISNSHLLGDIDTFDVYGYDQDDQRVLFFKDNNKVIAYIVIQGNSIRGIRNISGTAGLVTALIAFCVGEYGPMTFTSDEPFSPEGFKWLKSFLKSNGRGMTVVDQTGKFPDIDQIEQEWNTAMTGPAGSTSITISEGYVRRFSKIDLVPRTYYINYQNTL